MRRTRQLAVVTTILVALAVALAGIGNAASATSIVGTWSGHLTRGSSGPRQAFAVTIKGGERSGTWRISSRCSGSLRLKDISGGYHHYYRLGTKGCAAAGVDCLQRAGARMIDVFVPNSGGPDSTGTFRRIR